MHPSLLFYSVKGQMILLIKGRIVHLNRLTEDMDRQSHAHPFITSTFPLIITTVLHYSQTGCSLASNIAILSHNIAVLIGRLLWAICNRREQIASWKSQKICKQSFWLDYKKEESTNPVAQTIWLASLFLIVQSIVESMCFLPQDISAIPAHSATGDFRKTCDHVEDFHGLYPRDSTYLISFFHLKFIL